jgi:hypothetical protein
MTLEKLDQFYDRWNKEGIAYGAKPFEAYHEPYFITDEQASFFAESLEGLQAVVEKVTRRFLEGEFREVFQFDSRLLDLILADPGYPILIPVSRWDTYYDGKDLKCIELNTDGTSGMTYVEALDHLYLEVFKRRGQACQMKSHLLETLLHCYREFKNKRTEQPQIAIVDWQNVPTRPEQAGLCDFFNLQGYKTVLVDPRALMYDGSSLWADDFCIDLIYRRVVTGEYLRAWDEVTAMTRAYLDQNVCLAGSFRSQIGFDKRTFAILSSEAFEGFFTSQEKELCRRFIPWTRLLKEGDARFKGKRIRIPDDLELHRESFVLKPPDSNRGQGILFADRMSLQDWKSQIRKKLSCDYIVQEKLKVPKWVNTSSQKSDLTQSWGFHLGHFMIGGKIKGWMCRVGQDELLNDRSDDRLIPCFRI